MATTRAMLERRRSSRVLIRIPVKVFSDGSHGEPLDVAAEAIAVSRFGALIRVPLSPALGSRIEVLHPVSQETQEFRVVRVVPKDDGLFELGVEILYPSRNFWGIQFPGERLPVDSLA
jgi:PilZ domain